MPSFIAAPKGNELVVQILLNTQEEKLAINTQWSITGATPLYQAFWRNDHDVVRTLLNNNNIDVNIPDKNDSTPLFISSEKRFSDSILELLIE